MSSLRQSPLPTLTALSSTFTELTTILQPLQAHNYEQLNAALQANSSASEKAAEDELHGRLDAARMQVSVAYVLMDLVWILLKVKGVDPTNHPVMQELERVKSYFGKIKRVQEQEKEPEQQHNGSKVDKSAAGRFIRAALAGEPGSTPGKHTKFEDEPTEKVEQAKASPSKRVMPAAAATTVATPTSQKKRPAMDPFEGYDKPKTPKTAATPPSTNQTSSAPSSPSKRHKKKKSSVK